MKHIIQFHVYKGDTHYVAEGTDVPVVTQGKTLDELAHTIQEAVELQLEGENLADFNLAPQPSILADGSAQTLTIPNHDELDKGTLKAIYNQALRYISEENLREHFYTK